MIEKYIVERGFSEGWIKANKPKKKTGKKIAVVGSGPAGLAAAQQLNFAGHKVVVYERDEKIGGLLRYGIPDFKLEKSIIDRRVNILIEEGITFITSTEIGNDISIKKLYKNNDVVLLCGGATIKRDLPIPGFDAVGIVQAMDFLKNQNEIIDNKKTMIPDLNANNKNVIVIGGGDTGSDCIGTSNRQGAKSVVNFEILPKPPKERSLENPWPYWPFTLKSSSSHEEGSNRNWSILTKEFIKDDNGKLTGLKTVKVEWEKSVNERPKLIEIEGSEKVWPCDLVLLALGFTGPEKNILQKLKLKMDSSNKPKTNEYKTNDSKVFAAGDLRRGQSLIVWAISSIISRSFNFRIGVGKRDYIEKTIYGFEKQKLSSQTLSLNIRFRQKWGNISSYLNATQFLNDGSKKRFSLRSDLDIRVYEGLAVRLSGNINLIREQYNLAAGSTSIEDLLLQQRQIATDYRTNFSVGLSYTFGSIYNSIINTRL